VNPFLQAASEVLETQLGAEPERGAVGLRTSAYTTEDVTALVRVRGAIAGYVLFSMDDHTARSIVERMQGAPCEELAACVRERWPAVRFVLATGWGASIDAADAQAKGVEAVLAKPYHPDDLQRLVTRAAA
jgi:CheY-specific phosphatase CheX